MERKGEMRIFSGTFKTTDGCRWSVGFHALNWEDALSIGESMGVDDIGLSLGTTPATHDDPPTESDIMHLDPPVQHFAAWHYRNGRFINEDSCS